VKYFSLKHFLARSCKLVLAITVIILIFHGIPTHSQHHKQSLQTIKIEKSSPEVALSFDDGPSPSTVKVLDILQQYHIRATFFLVGKNVERYPDIVLRILNGGHLIGSHTYSHNPWSSMKTPKQISSELDMSSSAICSITGNAPHFFRPPFGWESPWMSKEYRSKGYTIVKWTIDPKDWQHPSPEIIVNRILTNLKSDAIILLHDGHQTKASPNVQETIRALPVIIEKLEERGFRFVTIDQIPGASQKKPVISSEGNS
jgi:peptidoglycan/xylan/chitin deacetylase (PgdA/CDA1 family)